MLLALAFMLGVTTQGAMAQDRPASAAIMQGASPTWQQVVPLHDGRTFVTDGSFALDAAIAKPSVLPSHVLAESAAKLIERHLTAELPDEFAFSQLTLRRDLEKYAAPSGVILNPIYVDYLRTLPDSGFASG